MTLCEHCHSAPASVHITQITNNRTTVSHLCEACARETGVVVEIGKDGIVPEVQVTAEALARPQTWPAAGEDRRECRQCRLTFSEFKAHERLGCPRCYAEFDKEIEALLMQVHGASVHKGKRHVPRGGDSMTDDDLARLHRELSDAIKREEFELAAMLRDAIRCFGEKQAKKNEDCHRDTEGTEKVKMES